jgi:hypothetical protein
MTPNQTAGKCEHCGRDIVLSRSHNNFGQPVKCICVRREELRVRALEERRKQGKPERKVSEYDWHASRGAQKQTNAEFCNHRNKREAARRKQHPERFRDYFRKHAYDLPAGEYQRMLGEQQGKCFLCGNKMKRPHIDHCHTTNIVRKLLCGGCNMAVGVIEADPTWIDRVVKYLKS